jgi:hypothetical protein
MTVLEREELASDLGVAVPPIYGRCPVCGKPLHPRCRYTNEPKAPPVGQGMLSRAKCDGCGSLIEYVGQGDWKPA